MITLDPAPLLALGDTCPHIADLCGVRIRQVERWRAGAQITLPTADRIAVRLGRHPGEIWDEYWDIA
jgi:hypothetical protein